MRWTIEPVRGLQSRLPDRPKDRREDEPRKHAKKDTFNRVLQEAREAEDGRPNDSGA
jgi:hypothetical protein